MKLNNYLLDNEQFKNINNIVNKDKKIQLTNSRSSQLSFLLSNFYSDNKNKNFLLVTDTQGHSDEYYRELKGLVGEENVEQFIVEDLLSEQFSISSSESKTYLMKVLSQLATDKNKIIITTIAGVKKLLPSKEQILNSNFILEKNAEYKIDDIKNKLIQIGFNRKNIVSGIGDFAIRGEIIDIFSANYPNPIRLDFFDEELERIKGFDLESQLSLDEMDKVVINPTTDFIVDDEQINISTENIKSEFEKYRSSLKGSDKKKITDTLENITDELNAGFLENKYRFLDSFFEYNQNIFDFFSDEDMFFFDDFNHLMSIEERLLEEDKNWSIENIENFNSIPGINNRFELKDLLKKIDKDNKRKIFVTNFQSEIKDIKIKEKFEFSFTPVQDFYGQIKILADDLNNLEKNKKTTVLLLSTQAKIDELTNTLNDFNFKINQTNELEKNKVQIQLGYFNHSFQSNDFDITIISESNIFKKVRKPSIRNSFASVDSKRISNFKQIEKGDFVVHVSHGIGRFDGIETIEVKGVKKDFLRITYAKKASIFVPVDQINLIQKYMSSGDSSPKLDTLGGTDWAKRKHSAQKTVEDISDQLIEIYAKRKALKGFTFKKDTPNQKKFDEAFSYEETADQIKSIKDIKDDLEETMPMDRLLVGDVGFGKTEVALRGIFKTFDNGKQSAFLVPTTILAQQHYNTIKNRFSGFDVSIGILSRFQSTKQNKETVEKLKNGEIDIVVGTHRLLSKDVSFKDLGLVVVDEEQRFGVKHKEYLKRLRDSVNVLTLTATPIPRTLNLAISGARGLSLLEIPPNNRFPIQTYVSEEQPTIISNAIQKEIDRDGQVFFIHNKVYDIEKTVKKIEKLVPDARVNYIHGQMREVEVERILYDFLNKEFDVLVSTTIIETGIDIPNTNTLIVEDSDRFGLSQLYQLRGRVGRSNRLAYAYLLYKEGKQPTEEAEKRLTAIQDFTELGSGYKLAVRDLAIRGAGDLLGKNQSGYINSVGYELFEQMLKESVNKKKGNVQKEVVNTEITVNIPAFIPDDYIVDQGQRVEYYKNIDSSEDFCQLNTIKNNFIDIFGPLVDEVKNLLLIKEIKISSSNLNIKKIIQNNETFKIYGDSNFVNQIISLKNNKEIKNLGLNIKLSSETLEIIKNSDENNTIILEQINDFLKIVLENNVKK